VLPAFGDTRFVRFTNGSLTQLAVFGEEMLLRASPEAFAMPGRWGLLIFCAFKWGLRNEWLRQVLTIEYT
jgi:hypothetical protein